jgi:hypothetical protein
MTAKYGPQRFTVWVLHPSTYEVQMWWLHPDRADLVGAVSVENDSPWARQVLSDECLRRYEVQR